MSPRTAALLLACLLTTAGCLGAVESSLSDGADAVADPGTPTDRHPLAGETVTVAVEGTARERALVASALPYWADNATRYAGFDVSFRVLSAGATPAEGPPDVRVRFVETVTDCGGTTYSAGCAPRLNASTRYDPPAVVRIQAGLANDSTRLVVRHEFGHVLGLAHDDAPEAVMRHERRLATLPRPNATERALPWADSEVTVALDASAVPDDERDALDREVRYGLDYYRAGADGAAPANLTVVRVTDPSTADVVVRAVEDSDCRADAGSCVRFEGEDPDADGAIETYTRVEILLVDLDPEAVSWHTARQFALAAGVTDDELPAPLRNSSYSERRGDWHG